MSRLLKMLKLVFLLLLAIMKLLRLIVTAANGGAVAAEEIPHGKA